MKNQSVTTIYVNPVPRISPQGRDRQVFTIINPKTGELIQTQSMNKTREFGVGVVYPFKLNPRTNRLETGLDISIKNPFYEMEPVEVMEAYGLPHVWLDILTTLVKQNDIKKQTYFEILDQVHPDFYTSELKGGVNIFNMTKSTKIPEDPNFLEKFSIILYDGPNRFSDDTPRGRLAIELIKKHNKIAPNRQSINSALHDFYISEENEAAIEKAKKQDIINDAIYDLVELQKGGSEYLNYQVAVLLTNHEGKYSYKGDMSASAVKRALTEYVSEGNHQMENIEKFVKLITMLKSKEARERFNIMYLVQQAVNSNVMGIIDGYYVWYNKSGVPNMYKHNNYEKLISLLQSEMKNMTGDESLTNWYSDLLNEVKSKGIRVE